MTARLLRAGEINAAIAAATVVLYAVLAPGGAHVPINDGLGWNGLAFGEMVRGFTLKGGNEAARLSPLFPALAWVPYMVTGNVVASLVIVNRLSLGVLIFAVCLLLDKRGIGARWKIFMAAHLALAFAFTRLVAFVPARPELCALAALTLAIALSSSRRPLVTAASNVAAVMAMPVGLAAAIDGIARSVRRREPLNRIASMFVPALLVWMAVQWWARGGVAGALGDFSPRALFAGVAVWRDPLFVAVALYFLVTAAGGLSVIALARPAAWRHVVRNAPETVALCAALVSYLFVSGVDAPLAFGFLVPVWVLVTAEWIRADGGRRQWWWLSAGIAITILTQRPYAQVDLTSYFVDWHPYDVYRGSAAVQYPQLWERWIPRFLVAAIALRVMSLVASWGAVEQGAERLRPRREARVWIAPVLFVLAFFRQLRCLALRTITVREHGGWSLGAYSYALLVGAITAYFLFGIPIQLSDSFANLLGIQGISAWEVFKAEMGGTGYLRPLLQVQLKVVYDLAHGNYLAWYRSVQALQVVAVLLLTVRILKVRSALDCAIVPVCLAMVLGLHTFAGAILEAFPINTFLTLVLCCLIAVNLAQSRGGAMIDAASAALLAFSLLTLETGLLVWVIFLAARLVGYKGVSRRGLVAATTVLAVYFVVRFAILHVAPPGLNERPTGFGFHHLEPDEIIARFGSNPLPLYLYNYACALLTVLFAEPRAGVWQLVADLSSRTIEGWYAINVVVSTITTAVIAWYIAGRAHAWWRRDISDHDRLVLLFLAVLPANAVLCVVYVKDVIMSPAGVMYAIAAFVAIRALLIAMPVAIPLFRASTLSVVLLAMLSTGWGWRFVGIEYSLRKRAADVRSEWAFEDEWELNNHIQIDTAEAAALKRTLMEDAIWKQAAPPRLAPKWPGRLFDTTH